MAKMFDPRTNGYIDTDNITTALVPETVRKAMEDENYILHRREEELMNALHEQNAKISELRRRLSYMCDYYSVMFVIKKVIFNAPATIVYWADGTKTVVKCSENDIYDAEKGLAMCFARNGFRKKRGVTVFQRMTSISSGLYSQHFSVLWMRTKMND